MMMVRSTSLLTAKLRCPSAPAPARRSGRPRLSALTGPDGTPEEAAAAATPAKPRKQAFFQFPKKPLAWTTRETSVADLRNAQLQAEWHAAKGTKGGMDVLLAPSPAFQFNMHGSRSNNREYDHPGFDPKDMVGLRLTKEILIASLEPIFGAVELPVLQFAPPTSKPEEIKSEAKARQMLLRHLLYRLQELLVAAGYHVVIDEEPTDDDVATDITIRIDGVPFTVFELKTPAVLSMLKGTFWSDVMDENGTVAWRCIRQEFAYMGKTGACWGMITSLHRSCIVMWDGSRLHMSRDIMYNDPDMPFMLVLAYLLVKGLEARCLLAPRPFFSEEPPNMETIGKNGKPSSWAYDPRSLSKDLSFAGPNGELVPGPGRLSDLDRDEAAAQRAKDEAEGAVFKTWINVGGPEACGFKAAGTKASKRDVGLSAAVSHPRLLRSNAPSRCMFAVRASARVAGVCLSAARQVPRSCRMI